jgi:tripartite-type tricarboxylate transporter receptor subunit TctC
MKSLLRIAACLVLVLTANVSWSQDDWPSKPVRFIVPSSPGGGTDVFARLLAQALTDSLKQQFVVENRPGASGNIGAQAAATSRPDGYTFLVASNNSVAINPALFKNAPFNAERDLAEVSRGVTAVNVLLVSSTVPAQTLEDFIALAKKEPGGFAYGSAGTGSSPYLGVRMIEEITGLKFTHVPYKGTAPAYQDLVSGRIHFMYADIAGALSYVRAGKLKVLAADRKTSLVPEAPTFAEAGWPNFDSPTSFSVLAPKGVRPEIMDRLAAEVRNALKAIAPRLEQQGLVPVFDTPAEFAASLAKERAMWAAFIQRNNITPDE